MKKKLMKTAAVVLSVSLVTGAWAASGGTTLAETAGTTESGVDVDRGEETNTERVITSVQNEDGDEVADKLDLGNSSEFNAGSGTEEDPYEVATVEQLDAVRNDLDAYYIQVADIDLSGYEWEPIGSMKYDDKVEENPFTGTYDGNGYEIENMSITSFDLDNISIGLFGVNEGTLMNINLVNCNIDINCDVGEALPRVICIGAVAGDNQDGEAIQNCTVTGSISVENIFWGFIGGIVGYGAAEDCTNNAGIDVTGIQYGQLNQSTGAVNCGGISRHAGSINKEISGCVNYADVTASGYSFVYCGGISGEYGAISTCTNYGNITGTVIDSATGSSFAGNCNVGGVVGSTASSLSMCINYGDVSSLKENGGRCYAGGIVGYISISSSYGEISDCYNLGSEIIAQYDSDTQDSDMAGRIAGFLYVYRSENANELYSIDTTLCNGEIPTEDIGTNLKNGENATKEEIYEMLGIEMGDQGTGSDQVTIIASGECGESLIWTLDDAGMLTISGTGEMYDFDDDSNFCPWLEIYSTSVYNIIIEEEVTSIGEYAFHQLNYVETISIYGDVESIGGYAFNLTGNVSSHGLKIIFTGNAPTYFSEDAFGEGPWMLGVDVYYSKDTTGWEDIINQNYTITDIGWIYSDDASDKLDFSDLWWFWNNYDYFGGEENGFYITKKDYERLLSNLRKR